MLTINTKEFSIYKRNEIVDENNVVKYWSQPDFAYKNRVHIYDTDNNEIGYVQYINLSIQEEVEVYDKNDNRIDINKYSYVNYNSQWQYSIKYNGEDLGNLNLKSENCEINITNSDLEDMCILFIFSNFNKE